MRFRLAHGKKKTVCPSCGVGGTFRKYVDTETGEELGDNVGFCDRIQNCGYHKTPSQHFREKGGYAPIVEYKPFKMPLPKRTDWRCPQQIVEATRSSLGNKLGIWMVGLYGQKAKDALRSYRVGTYPMTAQKHEHLRGAAIYWQIGGDGKERSGKVIQYKSDGHRDKELKANWIHSIATGKSMEELGCSQVLFGLHLALERPRDRVAVVESEKTAIIGSILYPGVVWVATGGAQGISAEKFLPLAGRDVIFFPDSGMYQKWVEKVVEVEPLLGNTWVSDVLECIGAPEGDDIADYFVYQTEEGVVNYFDEQGINILYKSPATQAVDKKEPPRESNSTPPIIQRMIDNNTSVRTFVDTLGLDMDSITLTQIK